MGRPSNKEQLLTAASAEFARLWEAVELVSTESREQPGACDSWSVKDLLAHLHAWHEMVLGWERAGSVDQEVEIPGVGFTWAEIPALNQTIFERTHHDSWKHVTAQLRKSHEALIDVIDSYSDKDLFAKKKFAWTGTTSVGSYLVSATSSHYLWASKLIRQWARRQKDQ
jgi:hypothetical protein